MKGWKKCPSVTPGGKPFFYHNAARKLWVTWGRVEAKWVIQHRSGIELSIVGAFGTPTAAMKAAERIEV